jgi:multidrug transporter EmrE-like cation transporter
MFGSERNRSHLPRSVVGTGVRVCRYRGSSIEGETVNATKMMAIALMVAGVLGLAYGGFTYTKETHETRIGPLVLSVADKETVNVPIWAGVGAIVIGGLLLGFGGRKS